MYGKEDLMKSGRFKKSNSVIEMTKQNFFKYLNESNLKIYSDYFEVTANISNGKKFRASYNDLVLSTSKICEEFGVISNTSNL